jgi:hypothetical protein
LQIEIQDYHRDQLEKDGISLSPREETVLTLSGNFTQKDLDKAAKKQSSRSKPIAAPSVEKSLDSETLSDAIAATAKPKSPKRSAKSKAILTRPEALAIAQKFGFNGTGQNLYDWAKAALTAKSEESKLSNREKLAAVGLVAVFSPENKPAWQAKD